MKFKKILLILLPTIIIISGCKKLSDEEKFFNFFYKMMEYKQETNIANLFEFETITKCYGYMRENDNIDNDIISIELYGKPVSCHFIPFYMQGCNGDCTNYDLDILKDWKLQFNLSVDPDQRFFKKEKSKFSTHRNFIEIEEFLYEDFMERGFEEIYIGLENTVNPILVIEMFEAILSAYQRTLISRFNKDNNSNEIKVSFKKLEKYFHEKPEITIGKKITKRILPPDKKVKPIKRIEVNPI